MITTTLNRIKVHSPCKDGWEKLLKHLGKTNADDEPLPYSVIVESNGLEDALWCCRAEPQHAKEWRLFAVWCGRQVEYLMKDARSKEALNVAERHANGQATDKELVAALDAAGAAKGAAWAAGEVTLAVAWTAREAALDAALAAAWTAWALGAAGAAARSAWYAARVSAGVVERNAQTKKFLEIVKEDAP